MPFGALFQKYSSLVSVFQRVSDVSLIFFALYLAAGLWDVEWVRRYSLAAAWGCLFYLLFAEFRQIYASWRTTSLAAEFRHVFLICVAVTLGLVTIAFMTKTSSNYSRLAIGTWFLLMPFLLGVQRATLRGLLWLLRSRGFNSRNAVIVGLTPVGMQLKRSIESEYWTGLRVLGFYDDSAAPRMHREPAMSEEPLIGAVEDLIGDVHEGRIDYVYIALPLSAKERIVEIVNALADATASVYVVPDLFVSDLAHGHWSALGNVPVVSVYDSPFLGADGWVKRLEDLVLGSIFLAIAALPMLFISAGIKLTSPGPVLFKQRRYGLEGNVVDVMKFRTMSVCEDGRNVPQATANDPRVTSFGAFLRRTSLDELPQFFNVLRGDMSIVGPRPHAVAHNEQYRRLIHGYMLRHKVKPGITGWAQVNGWRGETDTLEKMQKRVEYDLEYVRDWSLLFDLKIIGLTILRGFTGKNAY
jgi:putative colanic acid biosynthesis UDP-glucose lipid carrier transferase